MITKKGGDDLGPHIVERRRMLQAADDFKTAFRSTGERPKETVADQKGQMGVVVNKHFSRDIGLEEGGDDE